MSDELIDATVQSVVNGALEQTGTTVDQTLAQTDGIVDQTLAQSDGIVDQTLAQTDGIVDQTLAQSDGVVNQTLAGTRPAVDKALEQTGVGGGKTQTSATPGEATGQHGATTPESATAGDDRAGAPDAPQASSDAPAGARAHDAVPAGGHDTIGDPTLAGPPDLPAGAPHFPDPTVGQPPTDALVTAPGPPPDALAPPPTPGAGSFLDTLLDTPTNPRLLTAAGLTLIVGVGGAAIPRSGAITDSRLMIQLGMIAGFVYAAFLSVWFWATRLRVPTYRAPSGR